MAAKDKPGVGHNSGGALTDAERAALFHQHRKQIATAKQALESAKGTLRNLYSRAKIEGFSKKDFDYATELENDKDEAAMKRREREALIASWMQHPIGAQADLFKSYVDRTPIEEKAFAAGKADGLEGKTLKTPEGYAGEAEQRYIAGWHEGQAALASAIQKTKTPLEQAVDGTSADEKRRPGRPKGSKNKPKEGGETLSEALRNQNDAVDRQQRELSKQLQEEKAAKDKAIEAARNEAAADDEAPFAGETPATLN